MTATIDLDDQALFVTGEVSKVRPDCCLATEV
jgi:hypothetical protein